MAASPPPRDREIRRAAPSPPPPPPAPVPARPSHGSSGPRGFRGPHACARPPPRRCTLARSASHPPRTRGRTHTGSHPARAAGSTGSGNGLGGLAARRPPTRSPATPDPTPPGRPLPSRKSASPPTSSSSTHTHTHTHIYIHTHIKIDKTPNIQSWSYVGVLTPAFSFLLGQTPGGSHDDFSNQFLLSAEGEPMET